MNQIIATLFLILFSTFLHHISSLLTSTPPPRASSESITSSFSSSSFSSPSISTSIHDITLIGTVGGYLHAVNTITLEKIWSVNIGGPLLSAQELTTNLDYSMVPMIDGSLLYRGNKGVRQTSVTAKTLIENTPFHAQDGLLYNGEKYSKLYEIDLKNGQLLNDFTSPQPTVKTPETSSLIVGRVDYILRAYNTETGQQEVRI
jgi:outer membrane protein assembly factor BamB